MTDDSATLRAMAEEIADAADDCCNRGGTWWQGIYTLALLRLTESQSSWAKEKAELERQRDYHNEAAVEAQKLAHHWMRQHDLLLGFIQARPEMLKVLIENDPHHASRPVTVKE